MSVRVLKQNENAMKIAEFLVNHRAVNKVYYPGLKNHERHEIALQQMTGGFGGMVTFELNSNMNPDWFVKNLQIIQPTMSLAGVESTITSPTQTSHKKMDVSAREELGITKNLLRLSVGIEDSDDLIFDLSQSLNGNK